ncbi:hypothetical protein IL992_36325 [Microbispora sp. NEAU-D428]|uniref:hypothetical protein n=1 Tax=Microbispora sitophila TaxID=2771537 RepID=UPI001866E24E|nr:hypothetical protein [Microbispora sitophila]MBE3014604.1 hypothetical protein [Microbispora sitophila]
MQLWHSITLAAKLALPFLTMFAAYVGARRARQRRARFDAAQRLGLPSGRIRMMSALRIRQGTTWGAWHHGVLDLEAGRLMYTGRLNDWRRATTDLTGAIMKGHRPVTAFERWKWSRPMRLRAVLECEHPELGVVELAVEESDADIVSSVFVKQLRSRSSRHRAKDGSDQDSSEVLPIQPGERDKDGRHKR